MEVLLSKRLVDDINMLLKMAGVEGNASELLDKQNMNFVKAVANEIHQSIQVTVKKKLYIFHILMTT